jgi:hypothetical protein
VDRVTPASYSLYDCPRRSRAGDVDRSATLPWIT